MNRLSTSFFGQLFYLKNGLFSTKGIPFAHKNGYYNETFSISSMKHSSLHFKLRTQETKEDKSFSFESLIVLNGTYRELYQFSASRFGTQESYGLLELKDGWIVHELQWKQVEDLVNKVKHEEHVVHDSSCFTNKS